MLDIVHIVLVCAQIYRKQVTQTDVIWNDQAKLDSSFALKYSSIRRGARTIATNTITVANSAMPDMISSLSLRRFGFGKGKYIERLATCMSCY